MIFHIIMFVNQWLSDCWVSRCDLFQHLTQCESSLMMALLTLQAPKMIDSINQPIGRWTVAKSNSKHVDRSMTLYSVNVNSAPLLKSYSVLECVLSRLERIHASDKVSPGLFLSMSVGAANWAEVPPLQNIWHNVQHFKINPYNSHVPSKWLLGGI